MAGVRCGVWLACALALGSAWAWRWSPERRLDAADALDAWGDASPHGALRGVASGGAGLPRLVEAAVNQSLRLRHGGTCTNADLARKATLHAFTVGVGKGDCNIHVCPRIGSLSGEVRATIIDCGTSSDREVAVRRALHALEAVLRPGDTLSLSVVVTHADADHYNLIVDVISGLRTRLDGKVVVRSPMYVAGSVGRWADGHVGAVARTGRSGEHAGAVPGRGQRVQQCRLLCRAQAACATVQGELRLEL